MAPPNKNIIIDFGDFANKLYTATLIYHNEISNTSDMSIKYAFLKKLYPDNLYNGSIKLTP